MLYYIPTFECTEVYKIIVIHVVLHVAIHVSCMYHGPSTWHDVAVGYYEKIKA